jgi:hypothetical protein
VVIDYQGPPEVLGKPCKLPALFDVSSTTPGIAPATELKRGECDIKAFVWAELGPLLIISTDGDFVPMSLLQLERANNDEARIVLYRMATNVGIKRNSTGTTRRSYEYVDIREIHKCLGRELAQTKQPARLFALMCMVTGCDFCANLPGLGPTRVWKSRFILQRKSITCENGVLSMLCIMYLDLFKGKLGIPNHLVREGTTPEAACSTYTAIAASIARGSVNSRSMASFWSQPRALTHARNVCWTMQYWEVLHEYPDPVQPKYGFVRVKNVVQVAVE